MKPEPQVAAFAAPAPIPYLNASAHSPRDSRVYRNAARNESPDPTALTKSIFGGTALQTLRSDAQIAPALPSVTVTISVPPPSRESAASAISPALCSSEPISVRSSYAFGFAIHGRSAIPAISASPLASSAQRIPCDRAEIGRAHV